MIHLKLRMDRVGSSSHPHFFNGSEGRNGIIKLNEGFALLCFFSCVAGFFSSLFSFWTV